MKGIVCQVRRKKRDGLVRITAVDANWAFACCDLDLDGLWPRR